MNNIIIFVIMWISLFWYFSLSIDPYLFFFTFDSKFPFITTFLLSFFSLAASLHVYFFLLSLFFTLLQTHSLSFSLSVCLCLTHSLSPFLFLSLSISVSISFYLCLFLSLILSRFISLALSLSRALPPLSLFLSLRSQCEREDFQRLRWVGNAIRRDRPMQINLRVWYLTEFHINFSLF